ncbi:MAG: icmJ dotN [Francisellaceae bacterium]|nr:icmJ dotN [Francisellaceae bacterium]
MELLKLELKIIPGNFDHFIQRQKNPSFQVIKESVLKRDENTCRYCGFQSDKFQEVINIDMNYANNEINNLATACPFCSQCFFLDGIGKTEAGGGSIIYLPEITQADLNHFSKVLFCSLLRDAPYKGKLQATYLSLQDRGKEVETIFGPQTSNAGIFAQTWLDIQLNPEHIFNPIMNRLRLLPAKKYFKKQIEYWRNTVFAKIPI